MKKPSKKIKSEKTKQYREKIKKLEKNINNKLGELQTLRDNRPCFPLLMGDSNIVASVVDDTYDELRKKYNNCNGKIDVIVDSGGGDIDSAYNLANLFRKFGVQELNFIVPRWAKSAATLLVCAGDNIFMTPVAELGPLDPQITEINPLEGRLEQFSPIHIEATLELIRKEFENGNEKLATGLMGRLQFPMTLGSFKKSLEIAEQYVVKLLSSRMLKDSNGEEIKKIAKQLTTGYADHGFSINADEARVIGLKAIDLTGDELTLVWEIHNLNKERIALERKIREPELSKMMDGIPPELLNKIPSSQKPVLSK